MNPARANRFGTFGGLALVAVAASYALNTARSDESFAPAPDDGTIVVANLRAESLTILDIGAGSARGLALFGPPHEIAAAEGRLYITLGRGDSLVEVDPAAPGILRTVAFPGGTPHGLAIDAGRLFVTLDTAAQLVELDRSTLAEHTRSVTGDTPHTVAASGVEWFVTDSRDNALRDATGATHPTGALPESVAITDRYVVTGNAEGRTLSVFNRGNLSEVRNFALPGQPVRVLSLGHDRIAVSLSDAARVYVVALDEGRVEHKLTVAERPDGLCLSPDGTFLAVVSNATDAVQVFDTEYWRIAATYAVGDGPGACAWLPAR